MRFNAKMEYTLQNFYALFLAYIFYLTILRSIIFEKLMFCNKWKT